MSQNLINPINNQKINSENQYLKNIEVDKNLFNEVDKLAPKKTKNSKAGIRLKKSEAYLQPNIKELQNLSEDIKATKHFVSVYTGEGPTSVPAYTLYDGDDGGYLAIYTHDEKNSIYHVCHNIYVAGMIRVRGESDPYVGFKPIGYEVQPNEFIKYPEIIEACDKCFPELKEKMWLGGDTGVPSRGNFSPRKRTQIMLDPDYVG